MTNKIAIIRIRGNAGVRKDIENTLQRLKLKDKNNLVLVEQNPVNIGMIKKAKDFLTWGTIDTQTEKLLVEKRGVKDKEGNFMNKFYLHPPRGGFERKGIKMPFTSGGALGDRKEKINELIKKML